MMMKLRKTLYRLLCLVAVAGTLAGCIEEYEADIPADDSDLLVVEGTIRPDLNTFSLSRTQAIDASHTAQKVAGAVIAVRGSDGSEYVADGFLGKYHCRVVSLSPDVMYWLHIELDGEVYESEPQKPLPTEKIADIRGVQNTPESDIDVLVTPAAPFDADKTNYYLWTYEETWEVHPDYTTILLFDTEIMKPVVKLDQFPERGWRDAIGQTIMVGESTNYDGQHIQGFKMYDLDRSNWRLYYRYSGLVHQRAISKAEYEYELARRQAGSEMGGLFTPLPSALPTNVHCLTSSKRVIGFVGCSLNTSDYRFFLNAKDYTIYRTPQNEQLVWVENPSLNYCRSLVNRGMYLCRWDDDRMKPGGSLMTAWAYESQLNVAYKGAYTEEPDFWSLEENVNY